MSASLDDDDRNADISESEKTVTGRVKVTINDVARLANVSKKTVSRVINKSPLVGEKTREKVDKVIIETGYLPDPQARALAFRRSFLIGMIYDNPSPQYVVNLQRGILSSLQDTGFQLVLHPIDRGDNRVLEKTERFVTQHRPFGVILSPSCSENDDLCKMLKSHGCNYVRIASVEYDAPHENIRTFDIRGGAQAGHYLAELGHRKIAHVHGVRSFRSAHERMKGFRYALKAFDLSLPDQYIREGAYTFESGMKATEQLLALPEKPTAIFLGNDEMAVGAYQAIRRAGLQIPSDISIVGFDDSPMAARVWPPMTSVNLPIRDMGAAAAQQLLDLGTKEKTQARITFEPRLVIRDSTSSPKNAADR